MALSVFFGMCLKEIGVSVADVKNIFCVCLFVFNMRRVHVLSTGKNVSIEDCKCLDFADYFDCLLCSL